MEQEEALTYEQNMWWWVVFPLSHRAQVVSLGLDQPLGAWSDPSPSGTISYNHPKLSSQGSLSGLTTHVSAWVPSLHWHKLPFPRPHHITSSNSDLRPGCHYWKSIWKELLAWGHWLKIFAQASTKSSSHDCQVCALMDQVKWMGMFVQAFTNLWEKRSWQLQGKQHIWPWQL